MSNSSNWPINRTLSSITTPVQSGHESNSSDGLLHIPLSSSIACASPSIFLCVISTILVRGVLSFCRDAVDPAITYLRGFFFTPAFADCFPLESEVTVNLLKSPGLFSVFWPISTFVLLFPSSPVSVPILWWLYQTCQLQLLSPSLSRSIVFLISLARSTVKNCRVSLIIYGILQFEHL